MFPPPLPYANASAAQQHQALLCARQVLDAAYPDLTRAQWVAALAQVNPLLHLGAADQAVLPHAGLAALVYHLATRATPDHAVLAPEPDSGPAAAPAPAKTPVLPSRKQTYVIPDEVCQQLADFSYWSRWPIYQLIVEGARQLMAKHPEFQRPRPTQPAA